MLTSVNGFAATKLQSKLSFGKGSGKPDSSSYSSRSESRPVERPTEHHVVRVEIQQPKQAPKAKKPVAPKSATTAPKASRTKITEARLNLLSELEKATDDKSRKLIIALLKTLG